MATSNDHHKTIWNGIALGRVLGRATMVALALYVINLVYQSGEDLMAIALACLVALYAIASSTRDLRYGYTPWDPIEWTPVQFSELNTKERQRAFGWTVALKALLVIGVIGCFAAILAAGLETLGYVLLIGGLPASAVKLYRHYSNGTKPWYPSVPSDLDRIESEQ